MRLIIKAKKMQIGDTTSRKDGKTYEKLKGGKWKVVPKKTKPKKDKKKINLLEQI